LRGYWIPKMAAAFPSSHFGLSATRRYIENTTILETIFRLGFGEVVCERFSTQGNLQD
jgi:hypothetical protein